MLSLDNAYNEQELRRSTNGSGRWRGSASARVAYVAELKIDGLSIALTYERRIVCVRGRDARRRHRAART